MGQMMKQVEEQLKHNKAIKQRLEMDWSDKRESYEIEANNVGLQITSKSLLFKPGATRFPDGYVRLLMSHQLQSLLNIIFILFKHDNQLLTNQLSL
jgi:hypothetical protein